MTEQDIRWVQRFDNFKRAFLVLENAVSVESPSVLEQGGIIQFFEMTFELSWKLLKDYQEMKGATVKYSRDVLKQAFQSDLIGNGHDWIQALEDRNLMSHTYNESVSIEVVKKIKNKYFPLLSELRDTFQAKLDGLPDNLEEE